MIFWGIFRERRILNLTILEDTRGEWLVHPSDSSIPLRALGTCHEGILGARVSSA